MWRYERVEMFYHREPETRAKFVILETRSGRKLTLTELHLLPIGTCEEMRQSVMDMEDVDAWLRKSTFAYKARPGSCVFSVDKDGRLQPDEILKVSTIVFRYATRTHGFRLLYVIKNIAILLD